MNLTINKSIKLKDYKKKGLLIDIEKASFQKLNSSGLYISSLILKKPSISLQEVVNNVSSFYDIPIHLIQEDIKTFIVDLVDKGYFRTDTLKPEIELKNEDESENLTNIWLKLTNRCNLKCKYCYANSGENADDEITLEEIVNVIETVGAKNINRIVLTGGEPLLRKDILEIVKKCSEYGKVQLLTNGTLGDAELYRELLKNILNIQISLDSVDSTYNNLNRGERAYERAIEKISLIKQISPEKLSIATTPTPEYKGDIVKIIDFCIDNSISSLHINRFVPYGRAKNSFENEFSIKDYFTWVDQGYEYLYSHYIENARRNITFEFELDVAGDLRNTVYTRGCKKSCGLNKNIISVDYNGDIYLCASLHIDEFKLGNIRENCIDEILINSQNKYGNITVDHLSGCKNVILSIFVVVVVEQ